jgi:primosomal protein N'
MRVYRVSPVLKKSPFYELTYFSKFDFIKGDLVEVDFNNRNIFAVVTESLSLEDAKVEIRKGSFKTKKIEKKLDKEKEEILHKIFPGLEKFCAKNFLSIGEVLEQTGILEVLENDSFLKETQEELYIFPDDLSKKSFSKKNKNQKNIASGKEVFEKILTNKFNKIIVKNFEIKKYQTFQSPHFSLIELLLELVKSDSFFIKNIVFELDFNGILEKVFLEKLEMEKFCKINIVKNFTNAKKYLVKVERDKSGNEKLFQKEVLENLAHGKNFIFVLTKGVSGSIFCKDCHTPYTCEKCESNLSLVNKEDERVLFCQNCKFEKKLFEDQYLICKKCAGWGLFPSGLGLQKVKDDLLESGVNDEEILFIDESIKKTSNKKVIEQVFGFFEDKKKILLGSQRVLKILLETKHEDLKSYLVSSGPICKMNRYDSDENLLRLITNLENISKELFLFKREGDEVNLEKYRNLEKFLEEEVETRKKLKLPPFAKVLTLRIKYQDKRNVDKALFKKFPEKTGEIKKGRDVLYFWILEKLDKELENKIKEFKTFGDFAYADFTYENFL